MVLDFAHPELPERVTAIGGSYELDREDRALVGDRELLYLVGRATFDTSCCGAGGCAYALVPGFVVSWKGAVDDEGRAVSRVEPVRDPGLRIEIEGLLRSREVIQQVTFL